MTKRFPSTILATCCVPWDARGVFQEEIFRKHVQEQLRITSHLYVFGTAGEGYAVTESMFDRIVSVFLDEMKAAGGQPMVGLISLSQAVVVERIIRCREMGVRLFQISLPSWGTCTELEAARFFDDVCGAFRDCEFLHYNLLRTGRLLTAGEYKTLAARHPNMIGTKQGTDSIRMVRQLLTLTPELQHFFSDLVYPVAALMGECGLLPSMSTLNPDACRALWRAGRDRDVERLLAMQEELTALNMDLRGAIGGSVHMDGAMDKLYAKGLMDEFPLDLLPPYAAVSDDAFGRFMDAVRTRHTRWAPPTY